MWLGNFPKALLTNKPELHIKRGLIGCFTMFMSFTALTYLPIASAVALEYMVPLISLPLAALMLKEIIGFRVFASVIIGFSGVLVMLVPAFIAPDLDEHLLFGTAAGLAFALTMGYLKVHIKSMTKSETPVSIAFYFALICGAVGSITAAWGWPSVDSTALIALIGAGILGGLAHVASTEAVARAPLSVLAPFEYTGMVWAWVFDIVVFAQIPTGYSISGCTLIILAAVMVAFGDKILAVIVGPKLRARTK